MSANLDSRLAGQQMQECTSALIRRRKWRYLRINFMVMGLLAVGQLSAWRLKYDAARRCMCEALLITDAAA